MVYSTRYDKSPDRQISDRTDRPSPDLFVPGRDLRYRSGLQQYRGMVVVDPRGEPASQGSAVLSSARREFGIRIRRLRLRAKSVAGRFRRADPALASRRDFRQGQIGRLSPTQPIAELAKRCPGRGAAFFTLLRRAGTHKILTSNKMDPGSAAHRGACVLGPRVARTRVRCAASGARFLNKKAPDPSAFLV